MKKPITTPCLVLRGMGMLLITLPICAVANLLAALGYLTLPVAFAVHLCLLAAVVLYTVQAILHRRHPADPEEEYTALADAVRRLYWCGIAVMLVLIGWTATLVTAIFMGGR